MDTTSKLSIIEIINNYAFDNNAQPVIDCLNELLVKEDYQLNLELIFMAIAATQMYGFLSYLTEEEQLLFFECDYFRSNSYRGLKIPFYNRGQLSFLYEFERNQKVFFSAPTSFGKTSIVTEYILNNVHYLKNILFIVPTNSLLEELFEKYSMYNSELKLNYNIVTHPVCKIDGKNILLLTPEKFLIMTEYIVLENFDLIVMDEAYKIVDSHNIKISDFANNRTLRFRKVADTIARANTKVIFLSPFTYNLTKSMRAFLEKNNIVKINRKLEYVKRQIINISDSKAAKQYFGNQISYYQKNFNISEKTKFILFQLLPNSSIVYVSNYSKAYEIASKIDFSCINHQHNERYDAFLNHIKENYLVNGKESWTVYDALKKGIGIYISPLPRYIKKEIIKLYDKKVLSVLIVTTAFTEGVNTCASNLIFSSLVNGPNSNRLSDIDVLNVTGRAGRFSKNTVGKVFCLTDEIYDCVSTLQKSNDIRLENNNYKKDPKLIDYEIEMVDSNYLNEEQKSYLSNQEKMMINYGLSKKDLNISLNVSNNWKLILYKYFDSLNEETLKVIADKIKYIYNDEEGKRIDALKFIFNDLKESFSKEQINLFPHEPYEISPFDKSGEFTWGRLCQLYVSGSPKKIIENNIKYVTIKFASVMEGKTIVNKSQAHELFDSYNLRWVLKYYNNDLSLNMNSFYSETFKIVSNIIQYKIPYYLTFYISIYKLYIKKNNINCVNEKEFDIYKVVDIFEDGLIDENYSKLIDYGIPQITVDKIISNDITIQNIKSGNYDSSIFDSYEKIIIKDVVNLL